MLHDELARFDPEVPIARAFTPPASWYTDPAVLALEARGVFKRGWQWVGRLDQLAKPGDYFSGALLGEPWLVVRGDDGEIRAFYNVCRHHAAGLVAGDGCARRLTCPYHGWTYGLDGKLVAATRVDGIADFDKERYGLVPLACATIGPLVFLSFDPSPRPLADDAGPLARDLESRRLSALRFHSRREYDVACNWKVYVDNYLDGGYHVPILHRGLTSQIDMKSYRTECGARWSVQSVGGKPGESRVGEDGAYYAWLHPNFMVNRYGPAMDTNLVLPLGPDRTRTVFDFWFEEGTDPAFIASSLEQSELVQMEDVAISESVQRGLTSTAYDRGRYAPEVEMAEHHFHKLLAAELLQSLAAPEVARSDGLVSLRSKT